MNHNEAWHERRRQGIGGSDVAVLFGLSPYKTLRELAEEKLGIREPEEAGPLADKGNTLEPIARRLFLQREDRGIVPGPRNRNHKDKKLYFMRCEVDGVTQKRDRLDRALLEIKCPTSWKARRVKHEGPPEPWLLQVQHNMAVTALPACDLVVLDADRWELMHFRIGADLELQNRIIEAEEAFWASIVNDEIPQEEGGAKIDLPPVDGDLQVREDEEWVSAATELAELRGLRDQAQELYEAQVKRVKDLLGDAQVVEGAGVRVYYRPVQTTRLDTRRLKAELPDVAQKYMRTVETRTFRAYYTGE